ncbi:staygreen family protein [Neobacillus thermocopriae]|uniref:Staygreen protein domain-containing protein n=1 Tax=Neobacillus thermocopriae TaxID=1215031 RepID=A0A6B3TVL5_9BACI|nr:staygreen family protein [Neobacillus thermocopriae]MED3623603.1 staygreen family protein [Neobacillus thermocopriae]MED3714503.1 staygreen family protein [Neobacillus thermocopriae]NEX80001.1 hypothetical protein [Neobacillus thermocopriae]
MSILIPTKLTTTYQPPVTKFRPVEGRKYTLTRSEVTGELFLTIGTEYNYHAINQGFRDEVLAEWVPRMGEFSLNGRVLVSDGNFDENYARVRFMIFQKDVNVALKAIVYGDKDFFTNFPWLLDAPIHIKFESNFAQFNHVLYYGTPRQFLYNET